MFKNVIIMVFVFCSFIYSEVSHSGLTGTNIHTVYRWQFSDSAARANQSVTAADTMKLAYQRSDSTSWILLSTTGTKWKKIAYASNQNTLTTSKMTLDSLKLTNGINATGGTFSTRVTASDIEVSDSVKGVTGTFSGALTSTTLNTGNGDNELFPMDQAVLTTSNPTFNIVNSTILNSATLNTGYGDNELHPMNQGVRTTDDVTFDSTRTRVNVIDSIKLGTGSYLKNYLDTTFYDSLYDGSTYIARVLCRLIQTGNCIVFNQGDLEGTITSSTQTSIRGIPLKFRPVRSSRSVVNIINNGDYYGVGTVGVQVSDTYLYLNYNGGYLTAGPGGINACTFLWMIN